MKKTSNNPLSVLNFKLLWIGESISVLGDQFALIALPWLVLQLTGSSVALGTVLALMAIPRALFMLIGGAIVDKYSARDIMILSNILRFILVGILTALIFLNTIQIWMLFLFALLFGMSDAFYFPAQNSLVPQTLKKEQLQMGNTLIQGMAQISSLLGPALAGIIIGLLAKNNVEGTKNLTGIGAAFLIDTLSFLATIITSWLIRIPKNSNHQEENMWKSIKVAGLFVWNNPLFRLIFLIVMVLNFFIVGPFTVGVPVLVNNKFAEGATAYGIITATFGGGSLVGIILSGVLPKIRSRLFGPLIMVLIGLQGITLAFIAYSSSLPLTVFITSIMGVLSGYTNLLAFTWLQKRIPEALMGRVISLIMFASTGLIPVSSMLSGFLLTFSVTIVFLGAGVLTALFSFIMVLNPLLAKMGDD
ncbi:MFS transporter [Candidatus Roizmanbacteria bacterium]|nr:MFS transporter [Candidatus Roizmanbacteria bacterium]